MRSVEFKQDSFEELAQWVTQDRKTYQRIVRLISEVRRAPFEGIGKPEPLRGNLSGCWSRRIDDGNRMVYEVTADIIVILSLMGHYDD
ncbi:Txe/YoeB family addiction module toxin [Runella sp.]|jgi:toxin YoeB|uniref:Txe/YoeB family addiction module toxin n=1 Tax=Runella sp. TaxID=1960881 RepID=UPI0026115D74|nr:Txe/YoeB family addiction module toxin [Runella sp.]